MSVFEFLLALYAIVAGLGLNIDSQFLNVKLGYDTEITKNTTTHYGSITLRMAFW